MARFFFAGLWVFLAASVLASAGAHLEAQTPTRADPAAVEQAIVNAINSGNLNAILPFFTDESTIQGFPDCPSVCRGLAGVRNEFQAVIAAQVRVDITDTQVSGNTATSRFSATSSYLTSIGVSRVVGSFVLEVSGEHVRSSSFELDEGDPETARFLAVYRGSNSPPQKTTATAMPAATPSQSSLPDTGSYDQSRASGAVWAVVGSLVAGMGLAAFGVGLRGFARRR